MLKVGDKIRFLIKDFKWARVEVGTIETIQNIFPTSGFIGTTASLGQTDEEVSAVFRTGFCDHTLTDYVGLRESFKYCTKCDHKENA